MPSYVVTGASRGLGLEFVRQLSSDSNNTVVGLVRNKTDTEKRLGEDAARKNLHILEADLVDPDAIEGSAKAVTKLTGGGLDYLIANAALVSMRSEFKTLFELGNDPELLKKEVDEHFEVNVLGQINLINTYIPLIRKGTAKKVIVISSGMADTDFINHSNVAVAGPYSMSKAALNVAVAKYNAEFKGEGILFMAISPGVVDTGNYVNLSEEETKGLQKQAAKMKAQAPDWSGPISPETSVDLVLDVINKSSLENGTGGTFVSHFGNKKWI